jgi:hemerythrin
LFATAGSALVAQALQPWISSLASFAQAPAQRSALLDLLGQIEIYAKATLCQRSELALQVFFPSLLVQLQTRFATEEHIMAWLRCADGSAQQHVAAHRQILSTMRESYAQRHTVGYAQTAADILQCLQQQLLPHITEQDRALARNFLAHPMCAEVH